MTGDDRIEPPVIRPAEGVRVARAGGAVVAESRRALEVSMPGEDAPAVYMPREDAATFLDPADCAFEIPGIGRARLHDISAKSGPIRGAAWVIEAPAPGAEALKDFFAFDTERVAVERI